MNKAWLTVEMALETLLTRNELSSALIFFRRVFSFLFQSVLARFNMLNCSNKMFIFIIDVCILRFSFDWCSLFYFFFLLHIRVHENRNASIELYRKKIHVFRKTCKNRSMFCDSRIMGFIFADDSLTFSWQSMKALFGL